MSEQTEPELRRHLGEQREFLAASAAAFDAGSEAEAKRLATTIRVLVHDTPKSTSLLAHLAVKDKLRYVDSAKEVSPDTVVAVSLVSMGMGANGFAYRPQLTFSSEWPLVPFDRWWEMIIMKTAAGDTFSRRDFVLALANQDGGAHIGKLKQTYQGLSRENSLGMVSLGATEDRPLGSPVPVGVRQIAQELMWTLDHGLPALLG